MAEFAAHPLTPERWADLERLFGERGACGGCWCMWWRLTRREFEQNKGDGNKASLRALVESGPPPGLLAYDGDEAVGWCAVEPRESYPALARSRVLKPIDEERLNVDGGAVAVGHPVGASGARIVLHLLKLLQRENARIGMASLCIGGGQGGALLVERATD